MPRRLLILACLFCVASLLSAFAQENVDETNFKAIQLHKSGESRFRIDPVFQIVRIYGGVHLTLVAEKAENSLDIVAQSVDFRYESEESKKASSIVFAGAVQFTHPKGTIRAEKATIYVEKKEVLFTGNPIADMDRARGIEAESIRMNLDTGIVDLHNFSAREILWGDDAEASDAAKPRDPG